MPLLPWTVYIPSVSASSGRELQVGLAPAPGGVRSVQVAGWHIKASAMPAQVKLTFASDAGSTFSAFFSRAATGVGSDLSVPLVLNNGLLFTPNSSLTEEDHEYQVPVPVLGDIRAGTQALRISVSDFSGNGVDIDGGLYLRLLIDVDYGYRAYGDPSRALGLSTANYYVTSGQRPAMF
jgi:hypothetical protein